MGCSLKIYWLNCEQCRSWSDCKDVQADLSLHWSVANAESVGSSRLRVFLSYLIYEAKLLYTQNLICTCIWMCGKYFWMSISSDSSCLPCFPLAFPGKWYCQVAVMTSIGQMTKRVHNSHKRKLIRKGRSHLTVTYMWMFIVSTLFTFQWKVHTPWTKDFMVKISKTFTLHCRSTD